MSTDQQAEPLSAERMERMRALLGLLKAYGNPNNDPTENELWGGCADAASVIEQLLATVAAKDVEIAELRKVIREYVQHHEERVRLAREHNVPWAGMSGEERRQLNFDYMAHQKKETAAYETLKRAAGEE